MVDKWWLIDDYWWVTEIWKSCFFFKELSQKENWWLYIVINMLFAYNQLCAWEGIPISDYIILFRPGSVCHFWPTIIRLRAWYVPKRPSWITLYNPWLLREHLAKQAFFQAFFRSKKEVWNPTLKNNSKFGPLKMSETPETTQETKWHPTHGNHEHQMAPFYPKETIQVFQRCAREIAAMRRGWVTASVGWIFPVLFGWFKWDSWRNHEEIMRKSWGKSWEYEKWLANHGRIHIDFFLGIDLWDYCGIMIDALSKFQNVAAFNYPSIHISWISLKSRYPLVN